MATTTVVDVLPTCDLHRRWQNQIVPARFDAMMLDRARAHLCRGCFKEWGLDSGARQLVPRCEVKPLPCPREEERVWDALYGDDGKPASWW